MLLFGVLSVHSLWCLIYVGGWYAILSVGVLGVSLEVCFAADPVVSNVRALQRSGSKLVDVWYDVCDADGDRLSVSVVVSVSGSPITASGFSGDVGSGVVSGVGKRIVWDAGAD